MITITEPMVYAAIVGAVLIVAMSLVAYVKRPVTPPMWDAFDIKIKTLEDVGHRHYHANSKLCKPCTDAYVICELEKRVQTLLKYQDQVVHLGMDLNALRHAATALYEAGYWELTQPANAIHITPDFLWETLREALGRKPGDSPHGKVEC